MGLDRKKFIEKAGKVLQYWGKNTGGFSTFRTTYAATCDLEKGTFRPFKYVRIFASSIVGTLAKSILDVFGEEWAEQHKDNPFVRELIKAVPGYVAYDTISHVLSGSEDGLGEILSRALAVGGVFELHRVMQSEPIRKFFSDKSTNGDEKSRVDEAASSIISFLNKKGLISSERAEEMNNSLKGGIGLNGILKLLPLALTFWVVPTAIGAAKDMNKLAQQSRA